ncbi:type II toxin-antitoxin system RelE/ParE family toxin [Variovorax soli]|uniref:type II toxin-antitoxin system RelE/ParE family toxin n=1 Tax=Variovorax soli TaxID=376815 RepID=UPI0009FF29FC
MLWRFATYVTAHGRNDVQDTIDRYNDDDATTFERAVKHLAVSTKDKWDEPHAKKLKGDTDLYEIRYRANRCATRAIGFFDDQTFIITLICTHKQNVYKPPNWLKTARQRAKSLQEGVGATSPLQIFGEDISSDED